MTHGHVARGARWWPAIGILLAGTLGLSWVWLSGGDQTRQERLFVTVPILLAMILMLAAWLAFFSRLPWPTRVRAAVIALAILTLAAGTLRVRGVTGDLFPILEWRWAARPQATLAPLPPPPADPPPASPAVASPIAVPEGAPADKPEPDLRPGQYPQYLGPDRNGVIPGIRLARDWTATPPRVLWRRAVGAGWSGFAVADGTAITQEQRGDQETVVAYDMADGSPKWSHGDAAHYESTVAGEGPRATPTISRGRVFTLGSTGLLNALDFKTGRSLWQRDVAADNNARQPDWGRSSSPLVVDDLVVVSVGGPDGRSLVAHNRDTGEPVWRAGDDVASYSSPQLATLAGVRQILILNQDTVASHDPKTGSVLWQHSWPRQQPSVAQPLLLGGDRVLFSAGYGIGSRLLHVTASSSGALQANLLWESPRLKAKFTNLVLHNGVVYGLDDGVLVAVDPADGERKWKSGRYGHGQVILAGNLLLIQTEEGEIVLVEPRPDAHKELARFSVFSRKTWNPPALVGRNLLVRTDVEAVCLELPVER
jgi:outer membrane protein assembly factor BamB